MLYGDYKRNNNITLPFYSPSLPLLEEWQKYFLIVSVYILYSLILVDQAYCSILLLLIYDCMFGKNVRLLSNIFRLNKEVYFTMYYYYIFITQPLKNYKKDIRCR